MKKIVLASYLLTCILMIGCKTDKKNTEETPIPPQEVVVPSSFKLIPIKHATMILEWNGVTIYVDPVGGAKAFENQKSADLILITDIHGDHFNLETLKALRTDQAKIIVPKAVAYGIPKEFTPQLDVLANGESKERFGITTTAIPMYNLRKEALQYHSRGRGNGYVLEMNGERIYISGDTEDIPEMRALKNIDKAFVCMNLPYTMPVESAADAVLEFKPKEVYPYHYRGTNGYSDVEQFKALVNQGDEAIKVTLIDWYKS